MSAAILLVEDEPGLAEAIQAQLELADFRCRAVGTLTEARAALAREPFDVMLLDNRLPDGHGLDLLEELGRAGSELPVVMLTSFATVEDAVRAIKLGAADYLTKPEDPDQTLLMVEKALRTADRARRLRYARARESHRLDGLRLLGESPAAQRLRREIERIGALGGRGGPGPTVLIQGETGTGKDLAARMVHLSSPVSDRPFVHIDCATLPKELIESELFGHEKGAFTQAHRARTGLIEAAEDGTVFLDEIGEVPLDLQAKLLAVLDRRRVRRLGSSRERPVEARFLAATNRDLARLVDQGAFRADLFYRLKVISLDLPPLRDRAADVPMLATAFAEETARRYDLPVPALDAAAARDLALYRWPGNVRELKHLVERAVLLSPPGTLEIPPLQAAAPAGPETTGVAFPTLDLESNERRMIETALERADGNVTAAARLLGIGRGSLRTRMGRLGLADKATS